MLTGFQDKHGVPTETVESQLVAEPIVSEVSNDDTAPMTSVLYPPPVLLVPRRPVLSMPAATMRPQDPESGDRHCVTQPRTSTWPDSQHIGCAVRS